MLATEEGQLEEAVGGEGKQEEVGEEEVQRKEVREEQLMSLHVAQQQEEEEAYQEVCVAVCACPSRS